MSELRQDGGYALRLLRRAPAFTAVALFLALVAMLTSVSARDLQDQWSGMRSVLESAPLLASRPLLLVTGDRDELFPPSHYTELAASLPDVPWARTADGDHSFSTCRPWMVGTVTDWLVSTLGT